MTDAVPKGNTKGRAWFALPFAVALALAGVIAGVIVQQQGGFGYAGHKAPVYLMLSEQIAQGHYGLTEGAPTCAPVPSILWPLFSAPFALLPVFPYIPIIVDGLALLGIIALGLALFGRMGMYATARGYAIAAWFLTIVVALMNLIPLLFLGSGHCATIFTVLLVLHGIAYFMDAGRVPWWLVVGIIVGPALSYNLIAVSIAAMIVLMFRKRYAAAGISFAAIAAILGGFSVFLNAMGAELVPACAVAHLTEADANLGMALIRNAQAHLALPECRVIAVVCAYLVVQAVAFRSQPQGLIQLFAVIALVLFFLFGSHGNDYLEFVTPMIVLTVFALVYSHDSLFRRLSETTSVAHIAATVAVITVVAFFRFVPILVEVPATVYATVSPATQSAPAEDPAPAPQEEPPAEAAPAAEATEVEADTAEEEATPDTEPGEGPI